jgi:UDP-glucose 4-epimerase
MPTIWITGGKGFIGKHLAKYIAMQGHTIVGIGHGLWPSEDAAEWSYAHWSNGEIAPANLSQLVRDSGPPETIYHLAGGSSVGISFQNPDEDFRRTVDTTARLLDWVRLNSPNAKVVCVSSAAVYGASHPGNIPEVAPLNPYSPYGFHKAMMESLCRSYAENFGLRVGVVRLFSVYGPELKKQLIWDICTKLQSTDAGSLKLDGTGKEARDWLHVSDATSLLWLARATCSNTAETMNGGTGIGTDTSMIAALVCRAWGVSTAVEFSGQARKGDPVSLIADTTKAVQAGFRPTMKLEDGISETVAWFKQNRE